jgi:predicted Zn-dependent peptidase
MKVLVLPRAGAPVVALQMTCKVGSVDEPAGKTGMAHLLEHMLFKGTMRLGTRNWEAEKPLLEAIERSGRALDAERRKGPAADPARVAALETELRSLEERQRPLVVKDEIDAIYARNGAVGFNAFTTPDLTSYVVSLPSNRLELWAAVESERMREPVLREYYTEREVVREERRERLETDPGSLLFEALVATAFRVHPYRNPTIGREEDLSTLDIEATRAFFLAHYGPDNTVVVAVGDVEPEAFFALVERYFGGIPSRGRPEPLPPEEPAQGGARRARVTFDAEPQGVLAYHKPTLPDRDDYIFDVMDAILSDGRSSRLVRELVDRKRLLADVSSVNGTPGGRYPNLFAVFFTPAPGVSIEAAEQAVREELRRLSRTPPTAEELEKVVRRIEAQRVEALLSDVGMARQLAYFQAMAGDWRYVEELPRVLSTVTAEEVSRTAAAYFTDANETAVVLQREARP